MKVYAVVLLSAGLVKANKGCEEEGIKLPIYPVEDSCAWSYEFLYHKGCASNCVSCGLCAKCLDNCISCYPGYEIDVMFKDGTGKCVEKGTAEISLDSSGNGAYDSTVCPDIALGGCAGTKASVGGNTKTP